MHHSKLVKKDRKLTYMSTYVTPKSQCSGYSKFMPFRSFFAGFVSGFSSIGRFHNEMWRIKNENHLRPNFFWIFIVSSVSDHVHMYVVMASWFLLKFLTYYYSLLLFINFTQLLSSDSGDLLSSESRLSSQNSESVGSAQCRRSLVSREVGKISWNLFR